MGPMAIPCRRPAVLTLAALLIAVSLGLPAGGWAFDGAENRATLKGVKVVQVLIANLESDVERDGLTREQLETDVESHLRGAGITVAPSSQGFLHMIVTTLKSNTGLYAYSILVEFNQVVTLDRDATISLATQTWSVGSVGMVGAPRLREVRFTVTHLVDRFIDAYLEQNPKK